MNSFVETIPKCEISATLPLTDEVTRQLFRNEDRITASIISSMARLLPLQAITISLDVPMKRTVGEATSEPGSLYVLIALDTRTQYLTTPENAAVSRTDQHCIVGQGQAFSATVRGAYLKCRLIPTTRLPLDMHVVRLGTVRAGTEHIGKNRCSLPFFGSLEVQDTLIVNLRFAGAHASSSCSLNPS